MFARSSVALVLLHSIQLIEALRFEGAASPDNRPNRIVMQMTDGCSGSSFIHATAKQLAEEHGYNVWNPMKEFLMSDKLDKSFTKTKSKMKHKMVEKSDGTWKNKKKMVEKDTKKPYCTEDDGTRHFFKGNSSCKDCTGEDGSLFHLENVKAAWNVVNGGIKCQEFQTGDTGGKKPTLMLFDGHNNARMADVVPFLSGLGSEHVRVYGMSRRNTMEHFICKAKDCFVDESLGYPVTGHGEKSDLCFDRRDGEPDDYKVFFHPDMIMKELKKAKAPVDKLPLQAALQQHNVWGNYPNTTYEDLTAFEFSKSPEVLDMSVKVWMDLVGGMGITPDEKIVRAHLLAVGVGSRKASNISAELYNSQEILNLNHTLVSPFLGLSRFDGDEDDDDTSFAMM